MSSPHLRREITGIALLLFAIFLAGALAVLGLAQVRTGVNIRENVGPVGWYLAAAGVVSLLGLVGLRRQYAD